MLLKVNLGVASEVLMALGGYLLGLPILRLLLLLLLLLQLLSQHEYIVYTYQ